MPDRDWNEHYASGQTPWDSGEPDPALVATVEIGKSPTFIAVTSDGRRIWGTDTGGDEIFAIDGSNNSLLGKLTVGTAPNHLVIVGDSLYVTVGGTNEVAMAQRKTMNMTWF